MTFAKNVRTPTLILQGTEDTTDPQGQSDQLYRPLKRYGVDVEYVLYPREPHGLREEKHLLDRLNRVIGWYGKYFGRVTGGHPLSPLRVASAGRRGRGGRGRAPEGSRFR